MPTYTVHEPPPRKNESAARPERFVFVRDGFHFWAFLLPPVWFIAKRLWLALILYMIVAVGLAYAMSWAKVPSTGRFIAEFMFMLVVGFEAATIQRWSLRKWKSLGFVVAEDEELAERRFFSVWRRGAAVNDKPSEPAPVYAAPMLRGSPSPSDVIGLFPEPGTPSLGTSR